MNILFVTWDGPQVSYLEGLFLPIFERLQRRGYRFHVLQFTWGADRRRQACRQHSEALGVPYRAVEVWRRPVAAGSALTMLRGVRHVAQAARDWGIQLLLPRSTLPGWSALRALRQVPLPLVFDADGLPLDERVDFAGQSPGSRVHRWLRDAEAEVVRRADVVLTRSARAADVLLCRAGAGTAPGKFHVVSNGRPPEVFTPADAPRRAALRRALGLDPQAPLLLYAGSLGEQYCFPEMLSFLGQVRQRRPAARLLVLTGAPDIAHGQLAQCPALAGQVLVRSAAPAEVPDYLACADLGLALRRPSFSMQGVAPIKIGEYLLCGLPLLATRGIGDVDALAGESACLLHDAGEAELERAAAWFTDTVLEKREALGLASRQAGLARCTLQASVASYARALDAVRARGLG